ncbi:hypothetical protein NHL50_02280 [Acidimicrobiia bacterium EGI L10123]|uniref:hypothetical protein n=1 Tax=Salinilacustrithrix flava TaxID=2957203 RepID=UPI003D7C1F57|nr:hypothetical protein [Acidimicrobiia bacterium EGI L10123]
MVEPAIDRAEKAAGDAGVSVDWRAVDLAVDPPEPGAYDLVSLQYPALRHDAGDRLIRSIVDAVAPGGTLLVVGHSFDSVDGHHHPHFDPADYVQPPDVADLLGDGDGDGWTIEVHEVRPREMPEGRQGPNVPDVVLRARRDG